MSFEFLSEMLDHSVSETRDPSLTIDYRWGQFKWGHMDLDCCFVWFVLIFICLMLPFTLFVAYFWAFYTFWFTMFHVPDPDQKSTLKANHQPPTYHKRHREGQAERQREGKREILWKVTGGLSLVIFLFYLVVVMLLVAQDLHAMVSQQPRLTPLLHTSPHNLHLILSGMFPVILHLKK